MLTNIHTNESIIHLALSKAPKAQKKSLSTSHITCSGPVLDDDEHDARVARRRHHHSPVGVVAARGGRVQLCPGELRLGALRRLVGMQLPGEEVQGPGVSNDSERLRDCL
jgi:hypothetical protein